MVCGTKGQCLEAFRFAVAGRGESPPWLKGWALDMRPAPTEGRGNEMESMSWNEFGLCLGAFLAIAFVLFVFFDSLLNGKGE